MSGLSTSSQEEIEAAGAVDEEAEANGAVQKRNVRASRISKPVMFSTVRLNRIGEWGLNSKTILKNKVIRVVDET